MPRVKRLALILPLLLAASCERSVTGLPEVPDVRPFVTGAAADALASDGTFALSDPLAPGERPIVEPERARLLASAYVRSFGPTLLRFWKEDRGRAIDLERLQPLPRVYYAVTPYGPFPDGFHAGFTHAYGPYYLVPMTAGTAPELLVAVAGYATQVQIAADGKVVRPVQRGNEFLARGVPVDPSAAFPTPEQAVARVARATGALVEAVPELVSVGLPQGPFASLWKITLDRPVPVRTVDRRRRLETRTLYVGSLGEDLRISAAEQPTVYATSAIRADDTSDERVPQPVDVPILPGHVTVFEDVVVEGTP